MVIHPPAGPLPLQARFHLVLLLRAQDVVLISSTKMQNERRPTKDSTSPAGKKDSEGYPRLYVKLSPSFLSQITHMEVQYGSIVGVWSLRLGEPVQLDQQNRHRQKETLNEKRHSFSRLQQSLGPRAKVVMKKVKQDFIVDRYHVLIFTIKNSDIRYRALGLRLKYALKLYP